MNDSKAAKMPVFGTGKYISEHSTGESSISLITDKRIKLILL
jgi:hypothetical protein